MLNFECDYSEGCHPSILERLAATNMEQTVGYGCDAYCEQARNLIRELCGAPEATVHFLVGGTQTNKTVIASILRPYQGVVCVETGHIAVHETGAIEATGHKVLTVKGKDGKLTAEDIQRVYDTHYGDVTHEHMVQPGMVYISQSTEVGTVYTLAELEAISATCRRLHLPLFVDGARLGYGLMADNCDVTLEDMARLCDVFYIGATKVGALFGEAVVITDLRLNECFRYMVKQNGGLLAKGRLLGLQYLALLEDGLYMKLARHADEQALRIRRAFEEKGIEMRYPSLSNQQFPVLTQAQFRQLAENYEFSTIEPRADGTTVVRFCTSWATLPENVDRLTDDIRRL